MEKYLKVFAYINKYYYSRKSYFLLLKEDVDRKSMETIANHTPRYSGANLSSPESAYSTGYSTDGTSPGAPPEYYINIRTGKEILT